MAKAACAGTTALRSEPEAVYRRVGSWIAIFTLMHSRSRLAYPSARGYILANLLHIGFSEVPSHDHRRGGPCHDRSRDRGR